MNGADQLCDVLLQNEVSVCFANPGTSEMHFVAALDRRPEMRCVLGLFEGVATGAADGYARIADRPAATLLHTGPGLANGLANLHNARRACVPMVNIIGDHAGYHLPFDAPLTADIQGLAQPMSAWVGRAETAADVRRVTEQAIVEAWRNSNVASMILPADAAWGAVDAAPAGPVSLPARRQVPAESIEAAARALHRAGQRDDRTVLILSGRALHGAALEAAGRIAAHTDAMLFSQQSARHERGQGRVSIRPIPYVVDMAVEALKGVGQAICIGCPAPVAFFAYPGKPSALLPDGCKVIQLGDATHDLATTLDLLEQALGSGGAIATRNPVAQRTTEPPTGPLTLSTIGQSVARLLPENAIICDESITSGRGLAPFIPSMTPHDQLPLTGGAIGIGIPLSVGAAVAAPDRKVLLLQADGSGMYTLQGLWTQARENLDVVTVIFANRTYAILQDEMRNMGVNQFGQNARSMLEIGRPDLDWCALARGMGVEAARADSAEAFDRLLGAAFARRGPFLIEAVL